MNIKSIITAAVALLVSTACSGGAKQEKVMNKEGKAIGSVLLACRRQLRSRKH